MRNLIIVLENEKQIDVIRKFDKKQQWKKLISRGDNSRLSENILKQSNITPVTTKGNTVDFTEEKNHRCMKLDFIETFTFLFKILQSSSNNEILTGF